MHVTVVVDSYPEMSETFVVSEARALRRLGHEIRIEAGRPAAPRNPEGDDLPAAYMRGDSRASRAAALGWLLARHPLRVVADALERRRWGREERVRPLHSLAPAIRRAARGRTEHLHAHFATGAALDALRIARFIGTPYSVTAHAYDIYLQPANLREKLERAAFATSGCDYTVRDLRRIAPEADVHEIVMGVDAGSFRRTSRPPQGRRVVAIGRLVEKKGFAHLIDAAGLLSARAALERLTIVGDGPLRAALAARVAEHGLEDSVDLPGSLEPSAVRTALSDAALLVMPCVVAADGDRDSMPVVVKEALAMEIPVVASDEVGLPELVRPAFGRLVPPGDPAALAAAIEELLALPPDERAAMGRAGREHVVRHCDVDTEAARLARLIESAAGR